MLHRLGEVLRGLVEPALVGGGDAETCQDDRDDLRVACGSGEAERAAADVTDVRVPSAVERAFGEDEERESFQPHVAGSACDGHRLVAMAAGAVEVAGGRRERRENVERDRERTGRPDLPPERDALLGEGLRACEVAEEPGEQRRSSESDGAQRRRRACREGERLLEPVEALTAVASDEPVPPEGGRQRHRQVTAGSKRPPHRRVHVVALAIEELEGFALAHGVLGSCMLRELEEVLGV